MDSHMTIAAHVLGMVAIIERDEERPATSEELARSVGTNPVVVRRVLGKLQRAGLVTNKRGAGGGTRLATPTAAINLRLVYEAVRDADATLLRRHSGVGDACDVAPTIKVYLDELYADAELALLERLEQVSMDEMFAEIQRRLGESQGYDGIGAP